jgi:glycosyltransferase involved in cell wall biosynthesis
MTAPVSLFFRHPDPIYFSLEKLFKAISSRITAAYAEDFGIREWGMPFPTSIKKLPANIRFTRRHQAAINHITGDIHYAILGCSGNRVNILTIHDCVILHRYPAHSLRHWVIKWLWYDLPVRKADVVTVISGSTRDEVVRFTGCDPARIRIIPDFVDPAFRPALPRPLTGPARILFIGSTPNKNLERLIGAMSGLEARLDIVGRLSDAQKALLTEYSIEYTQSSGLSQDELIEKYRQCDLLAFPTTYEGFGLPIIEAQAVGRPVLTSAWSIPIASNRSAKD